MPVLDVELNEEAVHSIRAPGRFETDASFAVELINHGQPTHVHLHLDDELDRVASLDAVNHYVENTKRVHVSTNATSDPVRGKLKIVTGYGSNTAYVDVQVEPTPAAAGESVVIDETLTEPPAQTPPPSGTKRLTRGLIGIIRRGGVPAIVASGVAIALGVAAALVVNSPVVFLAVGGVIVVALAASLSLLW